MPRCNVDIFDYKFNYAFHDTIEVPDIDYDYLAPETSTILISETNNVPEKGIIVIREPINFIGVIDSTESENLQTRVLFKPFVAYFNQDVLFDTRYQKKSDVTKYPSLERCIANIINQYWGEGGDYTLNATTIRRPQNDDLQKLPIRVLYDSEHLVSETTNFTLALTQDQDEGRYMIVNFYDMILSNAMQRYRVAVEPVVNFQDKVIDLVIGTHEETFKIDADLHGCKIKTFTIKHMSSDVNKLEVWNKDYLISNPNASSGSNNVRYYYLYSDGTYGTSSTDPEEGVTRITPVALKVTTVSPGDDTFAAAANSAAEDEFSNVQWTNYIELEFGSYDTLVNPAALNLGQKVRIMHNGEWTESILTGKKLSHTITLMFGTVRVDMTKKNRLKNSKK